MKFGLPNYTNNSSENRKIWIFWNDSISVEIFSSFNQCCNLKCSRGRLSWLASIVYAKCILLRSELWESLFSFGGSLSLPWLVGGDFNTVVSTKEMVGFSHVDSRSMEEFSRFILESGLQDVGFSVSKFTWSKQLDGLTRKWARLDRFSTNAAWGATLPII